MFEFQGGANTEVSYNSTSLLNIIFYSYVTKYKPHCVPRDVNDVYSVLTHITAQ